MELELLLEQCFLNFDKDFLNVIIEKEAKKKFNRICLFCSRDCKQPVFTKLVKCTCYKKNKVEEDISFLI